MFVIKISDEYNETRYGIQFKRGIGHTDDAELAEKLARKGISVEDVPDPEDIKKADKPIDKMTVDELKAYAAEKEIDLTDITVKADILAKIKEAEGGE